MRRIPSACRVTRRPFVVTVQVVPLRTELSGCYAKRQGPRVAPGLTDRPGPSISRAILCRQMARDADAAGTPTHPVHAEGRGPILGLSPTHPSPLRARLR